jgi:hypothetical protein
MSGRYLAFKYAWAIAVYHLLRSPRWSDDDKALVLTVLGALLSGPFVAAFAFWVLTGSGPIRWFFRPAVAFVNPFPRWEVGDPAGAAQRALAGYEQHDGTTVVPDSRL